MNGFKRSKPFSPLEKFGPLGKPSNHQSETPSRSTLTLHRYPYLPYRVYSNFQSSHQLSPLCSLSLSSQKPLRIYKSIWRGMGPGGHRLPCGNMVGTFTITTIATGSWNPRSDTVPANLESLTDHGFLYTNSGPVYDVYDA